MLVLTRKEGEKIRIGSNVIINIVSISENQIKLGIEAPKSVKILREELYENIRSFNQESSSSVSTTDPVALKNLEVNKFE